MIKVAISDDHPLLLEGLKKILNKKENINVVACYNSADELIKGLDVDEIDVLLLDINLGDTNSIEIIGNILKLNPNIKIIMLSVHNEAPVINSCLAEGAKGYLQKSISIDEILKGIETVYLGAIYICSESKKALQAKNKNEIDIIPKLTRREKEILKEAALGLTTNEIAEKLFISHHTVESHRKNLMDKFQTKSLRSAIQLAFEYDLIKK